MHLDEKYVGGARVVCDAHTPLLSVTRINGRTSVATGELLWPHRYEIRLGDADAEWRLTLDEDAATLLADTRGHSLGGWHSLTIRDDTARALRMALTLLGVSYWKDHAAHLAACEAEQRLGA